MQSDPNSDDRENTRHRILVAAERLFAERGVEMTFMRDLTAAAGVNLAAVNYHFRSKDGLVEELFDQLAERVSFSRLAELERVVTAARNEGRPPALIAIVRSFVRPYLEVGTGVRGELLARLILQHRVAPTEITKRVHKRHFDPMAERFIEALDTAVPGISIVQWYWRYTFMVSTVVMTVADISSMNRLEALSKGKATTTDREELWRQLVHYLCAGLSNGPLPDGIKGAWDGSAPSGLTSHAAS